MKAEKLKLILVLLLQIALMICKSFYPALVDTGRKLNVHKTFNLRPVSTGASESHFRAPAMDFKVEGLKK